MDRTLLKEKLLMRIKPLTTDHTQAIDFVEWYLQLGPQRIATIVKELMSEDRRLKEASIEDHEHHLKEIGTANAELVKAVGE